MADELPGTMAAQQDGDLDGYRASIIAEGTTELIPDQRQQVEQAVLPTVADRTPSRVRELVDREVARIDPEAAARREQAAHRRRGVRVERGQNGMGTLRADVSVADAEVSFQVLDRIAAAVQAAGLAAGRGRSQIRADVFSDLFKDLAATGRASIDRPAGHAEDTAGAQQPGPSHNRDGGEEPDPSVASGTADIPETDHSSASQDTPDTVDIAEADGILDSEGTADTSDTSETDDTLDSAGTADTPDTVDNADSATAFGAADTDRRATSTAEHPAASMSQDAADVASGRRAGAGWAVPVCINVYVCASTLAGWDDQPGELAGHGVISADFARALAESAGTIRAIAVHPPPAVGPPHGALPGPARREWTDTGHSGDPVRSRWCGSVLDAGRTARRPPRATADHVVARDRICTFTGCRARAEKCDLDHRLPWDSGGATCPCNQDPLCRFHHVIKTFTPWQATPGADGALVWTSPIGRRYGTEPGHALLDGHSPVDGHPAPRRRPQRAGTPADDDVPISRTTPAGLPPCVDELPIADAPADDPPPFWTQAAARADPCVAATDPPERLRRGRRVAAHGGRTSGDEVGLTDPSRPGRTRGSVNSSGRIGSYPDSV
jgi:hypothetical protein